MISHQKIIVADAAVGHEAFADWYRFGPDVGTDLPLVVFFGGAISAETYESRRETEPLPVREVFEGATGETGIESVDLLVVPCPLIDRTDADLRARISTFFASELLARLPNPAPRMAFFGNSAGAHFATLLAFELAAVCAVATTGGVGMAEAARESSLRLFAGKRYRCFANEDDPVSRYTHEFWEEMLWHDVAVDVIERAGGHDFDDYAANGSVKEGFAFVLQALKGEWTG